MSYNPEKYIYTPGQKEPFEVSRYRIDMFKECPRCFYLYARKRVKRPSWPAFTLNSAVDILLKKEFDVHRAEKESHPLMKSYGINAVPFQHPKMSDWRDNFEGVRVLHEPTNLIVYGAVDDIWVTPNKVLTVVDYKSTSTYKKVTLDGKYKESYKRQMEVYQWLLRGQEGLKEKGYSVSDKGFFVYANGRKDKKAFDGKLEFDVQILPYVGDDSWVEKKIFEINECLNKEEVPPADPECEYCNYREEAKKELEG